MTRVHAVVSMLVFCVFSASLIAQEPRDADHRKSKPASIDATFAGAQEAEAKINHALFKRGDFAFVETTLADVAAFISKNYSVNVTLDQQALDVVGIKSETPVTIDVKDVSLRSALGLILRPLELAWMIRHESLMITTREEANANSKVRVYEVSDLVFGGLPTQSIVVADAVPDFDSLIELIACMTAPESWSEGTGPMSEIQGLQYNGRNVLVIIQTDDVHLLIGDLLQSLRAVKTPNRDSPKQSDTDEETAASKIQIQVYPIDRNYKADPKELEELVRLAIGSEKWSGDDVTFVRAIADTIVVKHNRAVHRSVYTLLCDIGALRSRWRYPAGGFGGGIDMGLPKDE